MTREEFTKMQLIQKGRSGILRVIFGRTTIIIALILIQVVMLVGVFLYFEQYVPFFFGGNIVFGLLIVLYIINRPSNPSVQLSWVILTLAVPVVGGLLYLYVETHIGHRIVERQLASLYRETEKFVQQDETIMNELRRRDMGTARLADYIRSNGNFSIYQNTRVVYFPIGEAKLAAMLEELEKAEEYIFMEYFIIAKGYMWAKILDVLERKVKEGVEVRVMYDGTCAVNLLPYSYPKMMQRIGIQCKMFAPLRPILSTHYNNRDHRKILVIDGKVGFTGGINIGDEYINREMRHGHWKDTAVMLEGEAVEGLTQMFLQMWNVDQKTEDMSRYLNKKHSSVPAEGFVLPFGDSPFDSELIGETVYMDILNRAETYVHIMSPYLIIDHEMMTALCYAAKRGVEVKLMLPHIPDKKLAFALARSHYRELLGAGVQIYEYTPGFVHAKVFVSDDRKAVVGTINLDYRSLYLHFECGAFLYEAPVIAEIEADYQATLAQCQRVSMADYKDTSLFFRAAGKVLKLIAPLM